MVRNFGDVKTPIGAIPRASKAVLPGRLVAGFAIVAAIFVSATSSAGAYDCTSGPRVYPGPAVPLRVLWRLHSPSSPDYISSTSGAERDSLISSGWAYGGATFYAPVSANPGGTSTTQLYRLYKGWDHMDSPNPGEGGYATEGGLAYPWKNETQTAGLTELRRGYNASTGDHALMTPDAPLSGYTPEYLGLWGYQRYGNAAEALLSLSAAGVQISSNRVAGGSLWSWIYKGRQYVDHADYGREIQTSVFPIANGSICKELGNPNSNPTEAGDANSGTSLRPGDKHGSPAITFFNSEEGSSEPTQITRAVPLEWNPAEFGGSIDNPVARISMQIGKDITLNFKNLGPVARYRTAIVSPVEMGAFWETTGYTPSEFNEYRGYDASAQAEVGLYPESGNPNGADFYPGSGAGGVILSNSGGTGAIGVYGRTAAAGGDVTLFRVFNFLKESSPTSKWQVARHVTLPAGYSFWNQYLITGSLSEVETKMRVLYLAGY
jgi:hypothetical protein